MQEIGFGTFTCILSTDPKHAKYLWLLRRDYIVTWVPRIGYYGAVNSLSISNRYILSFRISEVYFKA